MEERVRFNWSGIFSKILFLVAFALILLWLYPKNTSSPFYDKIFNENVQTMKDAARDYFTVDRLPEKNGETVKITMGDMVKGKMILSFKDKNNKSCDSDNSYVEAKRISSENYELKVSLTCGSESDYIIDTIGCYDVCDNDCNSSSTDIDDIDNASAIEYEFSRSINKMEYSCEAGYVLSGVHCYKSSILDKYKADVTSTDGKTVTTDAKISDGSTVFQYANPNVKTSYVCGSEFDNAGTYDSPTTCTKKTTYTAASQKTTTYICGTEYINHGSYSTPTMCYKTAEITVPATKISKYICGSEYDNAGTYTVPTTCKKTVTATASKTTAYVCGSEYANHGTYTVPTTCYKTIETTAPATQVTKYTCGSEYDNAGTYTVPTTCKKTVTAASTSSTTTKYECSSAYDNAGTYNTATTCRKTTTAAATAGTSTSDGHYTSWSCGSCSADSYVSTKTDTSTTKYVSKGSDYRYVCSKTYCPGYIWVYYYVKYTRSWVPGTTTTTYTCSSAYDNAGTYYSPTTCTKTTTAAATPKYIVSYSCSSAYDNAGTYSSPTTCIKVTTAAASISNQYTCSSAYDNAGTYSVPTTCVKSTSQGYAAQQVDTYTCSSAYDNAGTYSVPTTCKKVTTAQAITAYYYTCSSTYDNAGTYNNPTTCVKSTSQGYAAQQVDVYSCGKEYDNAGTYSTSVTCSRVDTAQIQSNVSSSYSCPTGYKQDGTGSNTVCSKAITTSGKYYCSDSKATLIGDKCVKNTSGGTTTSCKTGYHLSGGYCYKYNNEQIDATSKCVAEKYEYQWSTEKSIDGWGRTGKYRVIATDSDLEEEPGCTGCNCSTYVTCPDTTSSNEECGCSK